MIDLDFQDYCEDCPRLEVDQQTEHFCAYHDEVCGNHVLFCKNRDLCARLYKRLKEKMNERT